MKKLLQNFLIFNFSGALYCLIELLWRRKSHISMYILGGICFLIIYNIFSRYQNLYWPQKFLICSLVISSLELITGYILNVKMQLNVWNYSRLPFNLLGQVCLLYSVLWGFLFIPISLLTNILNKLKMLKD